MLKHISNFVLKMSCFIILSLFILNITGCKIFDKNDTRQSSINNNTETENTTDTDSYSDTDASADIKDNTTEGNETTDNPTETDGTGTDVGSEVESSSSSTDNTDITDESTSSSETVTETSTDKETETKEKPTTTEQNETHSLEYYDKQFDGDCFIGDSRVQGLFDSTQILTADFLCEVGLNVKKVITNEKVINCLTNNKYRNIYIELGVNELGWVSLDLFENYYVEFIEKVKKLQPDANVYVLAIIPVTKKKSDGSNIYNLKNVERFNERVINAASRACVGYLDITVGICGEGKRVLPPDSSSDGVHLKRVYNYKLLDYIISERINERNEDFEE